MTIDHRILLQQPTQPDIPGSFGKGVTLASMIQKTRAASREAQRQQSLRDAYSKGFEQAPDGSMRLNKGKTLSELVQGGHGQTAYKQQALWDKQEREAEKNKLANHLKRAEFEDSVLSKVYDQNSYTRALNQLRGAGINVSDLDNVWIPELIERRNRARTSWLDRQKLDVQREDMELRRKDQRSQKIRDDILLDLKLQKDRREAEEWAAKARDERIKREEKEQAKKTSIKESLYDYKRIMQDLKDIGDIAEDYMIFSNTGLPGWFSSWVPGTDSYTLENKIQSVKDNLILRNLVSLKQKGATLGQVTERELDVLGGLLGRLDLGLPKDEFFLTVDGLKKHFRRLNKAIKIEHPEIYSEFLGKATTKNLDADSDAYIKHFDPNAYLKSKGVSE